MKVRISITILSLLILLFTGCKKEPTYRIGVSQCSEDDWRALMNEEIEREIMFYPEASIEIRSAGDDSRRQIDDIHYFLDNNFDMIIVAPNEAEALTPVIREVYERGIPVLVFDRNINGAYYTAFQGADNARIGKDAALYAAELLPRGSSVIEIGGLPNSTPALERSRGFHAVNDSLEGYFRILSTTPANWNYDEAVSLTDSLLSIYPDVDLIYAHNDRMAIGASDVAAKRNLHPRIIGIDAAPHIGMKAVDEGKIDATFIYPTEGHRLVRTAMAILAGEPFDTLTFIPTPPAVDSKNVDLLLNQQRLLNEETAQMKALKTEMDDYWSEHSFQTALLIAVIAILLLVSVVFFLVLRAFWQHRRHKDELVEKNRQLEEQRDLEKQLNSQLEDATQSKLRFFTNVSHELRTPLTLIAEPVEQVAGADNLTDDQKVLMRIANKNVKILHRLINQILDFRKHENHKLELLLEEMNPAIPAAEWANAFRPLAAKHYIDFKTEIDLPRDFSMAMDIEKVERVVFNLLSNAFKYTPVKGAITFSISLEGEWLALRVADTGRGISRADIGNIFDRFFQADTVRREGSGIGLHVAKMFVELHGGSIEVESELEKGTTFTVKLPVIHAERMADAGSIALSAASAKDVAQLLEDERDLSREPITTLDGKPLVLVIDDNHDVRLLIRQLLKEDYAVIVASDGKEGIRLATRFVPDLIICDVMMPGMDGMETCHTIKSEVSTSHIPVLMLTACSLDEERAEGYESGADGYMSKPFNSDVLKARVKSLISNRKRIKEVLGGALPVPDKDDSQRSTPTRKDTENEFYAKFLAIVNEEMGNMDLNVDSIAEKMGMGRSQFYRKIKALTNLSPVELLRDLRLKRARDLLLTTDRSISEIAYEVGFSTPAYFTKCYREVYSETPSALRSRL